jgi:hypothetical protein
MTQQQKKIALLPLVHIIACLVMGAWWGIYFWRHSPSRELFGLHRPTARQVARASRAPEVTPRLEYLNRSQIERALAAGRAGVGDLTCGIGVLTMFAIGTGVYVRRLDNWLHARTSGQAVAFRGQDLSVAAVDANQKDRGVLR